MNNNQIYVTRIIHPVGQGGFYTETISFGDETHNYVYDCGGFGRDQKRMEMYLDSYIKQDNRKRIDAVYISHFHYDHINGLQYLLENTYIRELIIPQLTEDVLIEALVYNFNLMGEDNPVNQLLIRLYNQERLDDTNIVQIENNVNLENIVKIEKNIECWRYQPYNLIVEDVKDKREDLINKLLKEYGHSINREKLSEETPRILKKIGVDKCRVIYKDIFKKQHNSYSMTLFSGPMPNIEPHRDDDDIYTNCPHIKKLYDKGSILYMGDFETIEDNISQLKGRYEQYWDTITSIQVPHHGSLNNYCDDLYTKPIKIGIISVGNNNSFGHPNIQTLINMKKQGCKPIIVTEDKSSMQIFQYTIQKQ